MWCDVRWCAVWCDVRWCAVCCDVLFVPTALLHQQSKASSTAVAGEQQLTGSVVAVQRYIHACIVLYGAYCE